MPKLERKICRAKVYFDNEVDAVIFFPAVPPMSVLELELCEWDGGEVRLDFAYRTTCWVIC